MFFCNLCFLKITQAQKVLKNIDENNATGPDGVPARVLKACAKELSIPLALLVRRFLETSTWPRTYCNHWVLPLHKRGAKSDASMYRGVHLTTQFSKAAGRLVGHFCSDSSGALALMATTSSLTQKGVAARIFLH